MINFTNKKPGHRILELGGGSNPHPETDIRVDVRQGPYTDFTADFNEPLPIQSEDFEVIYSQFCIEHLSWRKVRQFISEMFRVLKPGGRCIIITANTEAQIEWLKNNPNGWDGKDDFDSFSCIIFGDNDYPENCHRNYLSPTIAHRLFNEAGFASVVTSAYGDRATDMLIDATKPSDVTSVPVLQRSVKSASETAKTYTREEMYDKHYFNGGQKVGGYAFYGYRDFFKHDITAQHVLWRRPRSVLELGAARGYVLKRLEDAGIPCLGFEISKHCYLTRVIEQVINVDFCNTPWRVPPATNPDNYDLCFSIAVLEHVPENLLPEVIREMKRTCSRGLHGIDFGMNDDGFDKTHCTLKPKDWWKDQFDKYAPGWPVELWDKEDLEKGEFPPETAKGDGKLKLNIGSHRVMFYHGWMNLDREPLEAFAQEQNYKFLRHDLMQGIPFETGAVDYIVLSHVLEHFDYRTGMSILRECRRVLKPETGAMRITVPDARLLTSCYTQQGSSPELSYFNEVNDGCELAPTNAMKLWSMLLEGHAAIYDAETMKFVVNESNLVPYITSFRKPGTDHPGLKQILKESLDMFPEHSIYVDCLPKTV